MLLIGVFAFAAVGCGGDDDDGDDVAATGEDDGGEALDLPPVTALPSASCTDIEYGGEGDPDVLIASDLPLQKSSRTQTLQMVGAINRFSRTPAGRQEMRTSVPVVRRLDGSGGQWDRTCRQNANAYAENQSMLGLIGTFNSGCAAIIIPVLNQAPGGGLTVVSPANTYVT